MHILLEGVIPYELLLMLTSFITVDKYFKLELLNDRLTYFAYSNNEAKDRPTPIKPHVFTTSGSTISQTCELYSCISLINTLYIIAAQMWALAINLPLMIGDKVPPNNEKWECFLLLLDILQLTTTRVASSAQAGYLEALIFDHHHQFVRCYPGSSVIPKLHYMVHFPQQILRYIIFINMCTFVLVMSHA